MDEVVKGVLIVMVEGNIVPKVKAGVTMDGSEGMAGGVAKDGHEGEEVILPEVVLGAMVDGAEGAIVGKAEGVPAEEDDITKYIDERGYPV